MTALPLAVAYFEVSDVEGLIERLRTIRQHQQAKASARLGRDEDEGEG